MTELTIVDKALTEVLSFRPNTVWQAMVSLALLLACGDAAYALQIESSATYRTSFAKGAAVAAAAPGTACGFVSGGAAGPFGLNSFPATFPPAPGTCPVAAAPIQDGLANAVGFPGLLGSGFTSYGGTVPKAINQFVFAQRTRIGAPPTPLLAKGIGGWDTIGDPVKGAPAGFVYYGVGASGGTVGGTTYTGIGLATDPFTLPGGSYEYAPVIESLALFDDDPNGVAGFGVVADSSLGPLWRLAVWLDPSGTANVGFKSFSALSSLGIIVNDAAIRSALLDSLDLSIPHAASLNTPYTLFPGANMLVFNGPVIFDETAIAYAGSVAEPATLLLLVAGLVGLVSVHWRDKIFGSIRTPKARGPVARLAVYFTMLGVLLLAPFQSQGASISGDITSGLQSAKGAGGTTELFAYSEQMLGRVTTKNASTLGLQSFTAANGTIVAAPIPGFGVLGDGTCIGVPSAAAGCPAGPTIYGPPVAGVRGLAKPIPPFTKQSGSSTTGAFMGLGFFNVTTGRISAAGSGAGTGRAAGAAFDPLPVSPGTYAYQEVIEASLQLDSILDTGGVTFFAVDSRLTDPATFYAQGEPLDKTLWYLTIIENGILSSPSDLFDATKFAVTFKINDRTLLNPVNAVGTAYSDAAIGSAVLGAFSLVDHTVTLPPFMLFPSNVPGSPLPGTTNYSVSISIQYGEAVNAGLSTVPEPNSLVLLALGALLVGLNARRAAGRRAEPRSTLRI